MEGKGCVHTSSPDSPRTGRPASSKTSTAMPRPKACNSPRRTGPMGLPSAKQEMMSVPPEIEARCRSSLDGTVDVLEPFGRERGAGRGHCAERAEIVGALRLQPGFGGGVQVLGGGAEEGHGLRIGIVEEHVAVGVERASRRRAAALPPRPARSPASSTSSSRRWWRRTPGRRARCRSAARAPSCAAAGCRRCRERCTSARRWCRRRTLSPAGGRKARARSRWARPAAPMSAAPYRAAFAIPSSAGLFLCT